ncbi:MAG: DNA repair exonuclease [Verrucomicrobiae bacterium]|nr:DNA repair exonuclease [Verrucomicrobiae bacterium]
MAATTRFLHTADWQLGKPFAGVEDAQKRALLVQERFSVLERIGRLARDEGAAFIVVAGDVFDSPRPMPPVIAQACDAIGRLGLPVYAIPGNHDHGGEGSLWGTEFFRAQAADLAPNLTVLLSRQALEREDAVLFPCPLLQRHEAADPSGWLREAGLEDGRDPQRPRVVLAHGSVQDFDGFHDDEEADGGSRNRLDLGRLGLEAGRFDYVALGDWHGTKRVEDWAWYAGTPEPDRFTKGGDHDPGNVLLVEAGRGGTPWVRVLRTAGIEWHELDWDCAGDAGVAGLREQVERCVGQRVNRDVLRLRVRGSIGFEAMTSLEALMESWRARLIRLRLENEVVLAPSPEELEALTRREGDPVIARVAARLSELARGPEETAAVARQALRELHRACAAG